MALSPQEELELLELEEAEYQSNKAKKQAPVGLSSVESASSVALPSEELSFLDKPSMAGPSLRETGRNFMDIAHGVATGVTVAPDVIGGAIGAGTEALARYIPGTEAYKARQFDEEFVKPDASGVIGQVPEESLTESYRGYQQGIEKVLDESKERSPILFGGGALAGALTGGALATKALGVGRTAMGPKELFSEVAKNKGYGEAAMKLLGGTATTGNKIYDVVPAAASLYTKSLPFMAAEGALTSKHDIIGEDANLPGVGQDVIDSLQLGVPAALGISGLSVYGQAAKAKAALKKMEPESIVSNSPYIDKVKKFYEYGKKGMDPSGRKEALEGLSSNENINATKVFDQFDEIDSSIGFDMGNTIKKADETFARQGKSIDLAEIKETLDDELISLREKFPTLVKDPKSKKTFATVLTDKGTYTPTETKELMDDVDNFIDVFKSAGSTTTAEGETLRKLYKFRSAIDNTLKTQVPGYKLQAGRFADWRNVMEQIVSGDVPVDKSGIYYGKLRNKEGKLFSAIRELTNKSAINTETTAKTQTAFSEMMSKLSQFQLEELQRAKQGLIAKPVLFKKSARDIGKEILDSSTDYAARMAQKNVKESEAVKTGITKAFFGKQTLTAANLAGRGVRAIEKLGEGDLGAVVKDTKNFTAKIGRMLSRADDTKLGGIASRLESTPGLARLGTSLRKALDTKNQDQKTKAIFVIMQNPGAQAIFKDEDLNEEEQIP